MIHARPTQMTTVFRGHDFFQNENNETERSISTDRTLPLMASQNQGRLVYSRLQQPL
jgi:hypothetical protein